MQSTSSERRSDLDWIRIGAFALLIAYHVGMYYATWGWHVKSAQVSRAVDVVMLATNPWRLGLLFLVSGAATRFMIGKLPPGRLAATRSLRLLPPLLFGMLVVVPPQSYFEVVEKLGYVDGFPAFYLRYLAADHGFCPRGGCLILPTWNHLWFVAYLWAYTMILALALFLAPGIAAPSRWLERLSAGPGLFILPIAALALMRILLLPLFGSTHALVDDWYNHAAYFSLFAVGFAAARSERFWPSVVRVRWVSLALAASGYAVIALSYARFDTTNPPHEALRIVLRAAYAVEQWCAILAILGFGRRWLAGADGPARRYLTDAIFPFYVVHQTVIIAAAHWLKPLALPPGAEAPILLGTAVAASVATYEIARRVAFLRPLFGLKRVRPERAEPASPPHGTPAPSAAGSGAAGGR